MALVQLGGGITSLHGSIGGSTFVRSKGGTIWKSKSNRPGGSSSSSQEKAAIKYSLGRQWSNNLTAAQRKAWIAYAKTITYTTGTGITSHHGGSTLFIIQNFYLALYDYAILYTPPTSRIISSISNFTVLAQSAGAGNRLEVTVSIGTSYPNQVSMIEFTPPQKPGVASVTSKYLYSPSTGLINTTTDIKAAYISAIGSIPATGGQRIFVQATLLNTVTGITSPSVTTSIIWA